MPHPWKFLPLLLPLIMTVSAAEPDLAELRRAAPVSAGLVLHLGVRDGSLGVALAQAHPVVVFAITADAAVEGRVRQTFASAGVHGQATVAGFANGRVPLTDDSAAVTLADLDALPGLTREEALRVTRPFGRLWLREKGVWSVIDKPRPEGADDWGQYHYDASMSDRSQDSLAGPAQGIQWVSGPQVSYSDGVRIAGPVALFFNDRPQLLARDAFSGLPLWHRDLVPMTRFTFLADQERVYIHPQSWGIPAPALMALDLRTGETLREYTEGITFVPPEGGWPNKNRDRSGWARLEARTKDMQVRLTDDGKLLQIARDEMVMLDAGSGRRLWAQQAADGLAWGHPVLHDGALYVAEGPNALSYSYTHWPMVGVQRVRCFDLATGRERWTYAAPESRPMIAAYNMTIGAGRLALVSRDVMQGKGKLCVLILDAQEGRETAFLANGITEGNRKNEIGGGHSGARGNAIGDRLYISTIGTLPGSISLTHPVPETIERTFAHYTRPVGCTVFRYSKNWVFGSLTAYSLDGNEVRHTNAARTACDVGAFPANGLTYITPNHCFCLPYLPGSMAFHPRPFAGEETLLRLERGTAKPTTRPLLTSGNSAWPMYLANNQRGAWVTDPLPAMLRPLWQVKPAGDTAAPESIAAAWKDHWFIHGPVSQASVAEDLVVVGLTHRQQIAAYDAASGAERWRTGVDGRVDSAPTLAGGLVVAGTRNGWVYALDRETGAVAWRFFAAPRRERIVVDGQPESVWPVHGSVNVTEDGVWAVAGRHSDSDGGFWWWRLDLMSGEVKAQGRFGRTSLYDTTTMKGIMANPVVMDRNLFLLPGLTLEVADGSLREWTSPYTSPGRWGERDGWNDRFTRGVLTPGQQGVLARVEFLGGYKLNQYGMTSGRMYVHNGDEFAMVGGAPGFQHRGGAGDSVLRRMRRLPELTTVETGGQSSTVGSTMIWEQGNMGLWRDNGIAALAMAGNTLLLGGEVTNRDRNRERQQMAFRLRVMDEATGENRQDDIALPARPLIGGIASDDGRVFVVTEDGTLSAFGQ